MSRRPQLLADVRAYLEQASPSLLCTRESIHAFPADVAGEPRLHQDDLA